MSWRKETGEVRSIEGSGEHGGRREREAGKRGREGGRKDREETGEAGRRERKEEVEH